jgi:hypothetical protein
VPVRSGVRMVVDMASVPMDRRGAQTVHAQLP